MNMLMDNKILTPEVIQEILEKFYHVRLVTKEEDHRLHTAGLRPKMPGDWDGENIWARYEAVGIKVDRHCFLG